MWHDDSDENKLNIRMSDAHPNTHNLPYSPDACTICQTNLVLCREVRNRELTASLAFAQHIKTLQTIGWSTFFIRDVLECPPKDMMEGEDHESLGEGGGDSRYFDNRSVTVWILRAQGRVRVRRMPW
jgi:hypothetical protein